MCLNNGVTIIQDGNKSHPFRKSDTVSFPAQQMLARVWSLFLFVASCHRYGIPSLETWDHESIS